MTRIMTVGMETTPVTTEVVPTFEGTATVGTGAITKDTTVKRSGVASRKIDSGASNGTPFNRNAFTGTLGRGFYCRGYFLVPALPSSNSWIARLAPGGTNLFLVRLTTGGKIQLWNGAGSAQIGSDSAATIAVDTWYRLALYGKTDTGALDDFEIQLDGVSVASATAQTVTDNAVDRFDVGWMAAPGANKVIYWDDVAINDDQGATQNTWPGAGSIEYLEPTADSSRTVWTAGAGATTDLFNAVDNDPPEGVATGSATDTSQIKNTNTGDTTGNYVATMETYTSAGLTAADSITLVQAAVQHGRVTATVTGSVEITGNPAQGSEDSMPSSSGFDVDVYATRWFTRWGTALIAPSVTLGTAPTLEVGRRQANTGSLHVCGMRIAVEYLPDAISVTQTLRPDADTVTTGWTATPLWNKVEEAVADGTVITSTAS